MMNWTEEQIDRFLYVVLRLVSFTSIFIVGCLLASWLSIIEQYIIIIFLVAVYGSFLAAAERFKAVSDGK